MSTEHDPFSYDRARHEASVLAWRRARLSRLTAPDGWLSLIGRVALEHRTPLYAGSAAGSDVPLPAEKAPSRVGRFERDGSDVSFTPEPGVSLSLHGEGGARELTPGISVRLRTDRDGRGDKLVIGALSMEVTERVSGIFVRVRDPESPARREFSGIEYFPIDPKWRVVARFEPYDPPRAVELPYEAGTTQHYVAPGTAIFEVDGVGCRIDPVFDGNRKRLYLVFWDPTSRDMSYGAGRYLYAPLPVADRVLLDFNLALSPPCAFTPHVACPLAPPENRLPVRVEAGERRPSTH